MMLSNTVLIWSGSTIKNSLSIGRYNCCPQLLAHTASIMICSFCELLCCFCRRSSYGFTGTWPLVSLPTPNGVLMNLSPSTPSVYWTAVHQNQKAGIFPGTSFGHLCVCPLCHLVVAEASSVRSPFPARNAFSLSLSSVLPTDTVCVRITFIFHACLPCRFDSTFISFNFLLLVKFHGPFHP